METSQTTNLVLERLTAWVDVEVVWYSIGSKKGKGPATEEKASDQNPYQKKKRPKWYEKLPWVAHSCYIILDK